MPGPPELILIFLLLLLLFGATKLPALGKGLGQGIRNFKKGLSDDRTESGGSKETHNDKKGLSDDRTESGGSEETHND